MLEKQNKKPAVSESTDIDKQPSDIHSTIPSKFFLIGIVLSLIVVTGLMLFMFINIKSPSPDPLVQTRSELSKTDNLGEKSSESFTDEKETSESNLSAKLSESSDGNEEFQINQMSLKAFVAVHLDPGNEFNPRAEVYWPDLERIISLADRYNAKLTIMFTPQWATYVLEDPDRLSLVRQWEQNGHEIAMHLHGPNHPGSFSGYTDQDEYQNMKAYLGTINDAMDIIRQLPKDGIILSGTLGPQDDAEYDWPAGLLYSGHDGGDPNDLVGALTQKTYKNGNTVTWVSHRIYIPNSKESADLEELREGVDKAQDEEIMGLIFHAKNYENNENDYDLMFQLLDSLDVEVQTMANIAAK